MTGSTLFHEVAHPFIEMIKRTNPSLFNSLVNEALNSKQGQDIMRKVEQSNTYKNSTQEDKVIEVIAELIGLDANNKITSRLTKSKIKLFLEKIAKMIGDFINSITGQKPNSLMNLNSNSSIAEITNYLLDNKIDLSGKIGTKYSNLRSSEIKEADKKSLARLFRDANNLEVGDLNETQIADTIEYLLENASEVIMDKVTAEDLLRDTLSVIEVISVKSSDKDIRSIFGDITQDINLSVDKIINLIDIASRIGTDLEEVGDRYMLQKEVNNLNNKDMFFIKLTNKLVQRAISENKELLSEEQIKDFRIAVSQLRHAVDLKFQSLKRIKQKEK